jgi:hypothetical protein
VRYSEARQFFDDPAAVPVCVPLHRGSPPMMGRALAVEGGILMYFPVSKGLAVEAVAKAAAEREQARKEAGL